MVWGTCFRPLYLSNATGPCWGQNNPGAELAQPFVYGAGQGAMVWCRTELGWLRVHGIISVSTPPWGVNDFKWCVCF